MKSSFDLRRLDVAAFCRAEGYVQGQAPLAEFERLCGGAHPEGGHRPVQWQIRGESAVAPGGARQVRLHLVAETGVDLTCQRCLEPMVAVLRADRWFRFVADEETAARLDEASDDDILVMDRAFDVLSLVEDELLLEWPLVPRHPDCQAPHPSDPSEPQADEAEGRPDPGAFAELARLRRRNTD
jgi:uncharacterized protein